MHKVKIKKSGKGLYDYDLYPISLFPDIHVGQDRHGYFSCVASGSIAVCTNVGSEKVCIIYSFDIADKPSVHILAIHTSGSGLSVECSGIGRGKADGIFYCIDIFRVEVRPALLGKSSRKIPSNKWRNHHSCFHFHIQFPEYSYRRKSSQAVHPMSGSTS
jgi:hypothetical protein